MQSFGVFAYLVDSCCIRLIVANTWRISPIRLFVIVWIGGGSGLVRLLACVATGRDSSHGQSSHVDRVVVERVVVDSSRGQSSHVDRVVVERVVVDSSR